MSYSKAQQVERAERARYLLADDLFAEMLTSIRLDALNALAEVDPDDKNMILRHQAIVAVTGEIKDLLERCLLVTGNQDGGYSMTESSTED